MRVIKKENRGGFREGSGAKRIEDDLQKKRTVNLSDRWVNEAILIGGNVSNGIRIALENYRAIEEEKKTL